MKNKVLKIIARTAEQMAELSCESTSIFAMYQPKTPEMLKKSEPGKSEEVM